MNSFKGQTKRPSKTDSNERGITLVALIITIIILIILAAVAINSLTHDGLADLAIKSTQDYQKAQSDEMNMLNDIDSMVKETVKNLEDGVTNPDVAIESVTLTLDGTAEGSTAKVIASVQPQNAGIVSYKFDYKLENETDYKLGKEITSSKNSCSYTYIDLTQEVVNNLKVTATDNKGNIKEATLDVTPEKLGITITKEHWGKTVDYVPEEGTCEVYMPDIYPYPNSSYVNFNTTDKHLIKQDAGENLQWVIWSEDERRSNYCTEPVLLVPI